MRTMMKNRLYLTVFLVISLFLCVFYGCGSKQPVGKIAVKINDYPLTAEEFNELFIASGISEDTPQAREAFLDNLITRKLLLQEAQREGLDKQEDFLKSIENFWEQSLLKIVIDKKIKEVSDGINVGEEEIKAHYTKWAEANPDSGKSFDEMHDTIKWQILRQKQAAVLNKWVKQLRDQARIKINRKALGIE